MTAPGYHDDAMALAGAIAASSISATEAMQAAIQAARDQSGLGAIATFLPDLGLAEAAAIDTLRHTQPDQLAQRPFAGVPTLAKDLGGPFAGVPVHAGSKTLLGPGGDEADSELGQRFRAAGFCLFGSTSVPEFGLSLSSEPAMGPICHNPLAPDRSAGGSSGGAAAAVAAGIVAIAHATDAGGSIRVPAACCGLIGLKPTRGAIPGGPTFGNHLGGIASELAVCRSVRDAALVFDLLAGAAKGPSPNPGILPVQTGSLRIGVLSDFGSRYPIDEARQQVVLDAAQSLEAAGHRLVPLAWAQFDGLVAASGRVFDHIVSVNLASFFAAASLDLAKAEPLTQAVVARGQALGGMALWDTLNEAVHISHALWNLFDGVDVMLTPMLADAPPLLGHFPTDHGDVTAHFERMNAFAPLAGLGNVAGFPALTLPFGADALGLPLPVQMIAPMAGDALLLALAASLEAEQRWAHRFPIAGLHP